MRLITIGRIELEQTRLRLQRIFYPKRVGELRRLRQTTASQDAGGRAVAAEDSTADGTRSRADAAGEIDIFCCQDFGCGSQGQPFCRCQHYVDNDSLDLRLGRVKKTATTRKRERRRGARLGVDR